MKDFLMFDRFADESVAIQLLSARQLHLRRFFFGYSNPIPGQRTGITTTPRDVLLSYAGVRYGRGVIDNTNAYDGANTGHEDEMRPGLVMAQITATKLWVPVKRTTVTAGGGATSTAVPVVDARAFKVGDTVTVGANTAQSISAINYTTNTLTVPSITFANSAVVFCDSLVGSELPRAILNEFVKLKDEDGVTRNKEFGKALLQGLVDNNLILADLAALRALTLGSTSFLGLIQWGDQQGQV